MIRADYILRMISQLAVALQQILRLRTAKRDDDAVREIDQWLQKLCGLNSQLVNALSDESLVQTLRAGAALDIGKALVIAELIHEEANILWDRGEEDEAADRYRKSLRLYIEALTDRDDVELPDYRPRVDAVVDRLEDFVLPDELSELLIDYYERLGDTEAADRVRELMTEE